MLQDSDCGERKLRLYMQGGIRCIAEQRIGPARDCILLSRRSGMLAAKAQHTVGKGNGANARGAVRWGGPNKRK